MHDDDDEREGISIATTVALLMLVIAILGWGFAAGLYAGAAAGKFAPVPVRSAAVNGVALFFQGILTFVANGFRQIPNFPAVVGYVFQRQIWFVVVFALVEGTALLGGWGLHRLETRMSAARRARHRNR
jgi:hypothetical protein